MFFSCIFHRILGSGDGRSTVWCRELGFLNRFIGQRDDPRAYPTIQWVSNEDPEVVWGSPARPPRQDGPGTNWSEKQIIGEPSLPEALQVFPALAQQCFYV